jgi:hypothetical protein
MSGRRLDVTPTHAISSMLATLTGAVAASGLGIGGTILGAAFMSLASTVGTAVYKHYLARSNAKLRAAAENLAPHSGAVATAVIRSHLTVDSASPARGKHAAPVHADQAVGAGQTTASAKWVPGPADAQPNGAAPSDSADGAAPVGSADGAGTAGSADGAAPVGSADGAGTAGSADGAGTAGSADGAGTAGSADGEHPARGLDPAAPAEVSPPPASAEPTALPATPEAPVSGPAAAQRRHVSRRTWLMAAAGAIGVFVIAMGAITAFEAIAGKPLEAVVWHRHATGTTLGNAVHSHPSHHRSTVRPSTSPHPSGSATAPRSTSPSTTPSNSPSPATSPSTTANPTTSPTSGVTSPAVGASQTPAA